MRNFITITAHLENALAKLRRKLLSLGTTILFFFALCFSNNKKKKRKKKKMTKYKSPHFYTWLDNKFLTHPNLKTLTTRTKYNVWKLNSVNSVDREKYNIPEIFIFQLKSFTFTKIWLISDIWNWRLGTAIW